VKKGPQSLAALRDVSRSGSTVLRNDAGPCYRRDCPPACMTRTKLPTFVNSLDIGSPPFNLLTTTPSLRLETWLSTPGFRSQSGRRSRISPKGRLRRKSSAKTHTPTCIRNNGQYGPTCRLCSTRRSSHCCFVSGGQPARPSQMAPDSRLRCSAPFWRAPPMSPLAHRHICTKARAPCRILRCGRANRAPTSRWSKSQSTQGSIDQLS
jgi:hypothetical protein